MKGKKNLKPLEKFLSEEISPKQLARILDELAYDYMKLSSYLQCPEDNRQLYFHPRVSDFLYYLKTLRDILKTCKA